MRLLGSLTLRCKYCNTHMEYERAIDPGIPDRVKTILSVCPNCDDGDFHSETWLDILGREVPQI